MALDGGGDWRANERGRARERHSGLLTCDAALRGWPPMACLPSQRRPTCRCPWSEPHLLRGGQGAGRAQQAAVAFRRGGVAADGRRRRRTTEGTRGGDHRLDELRRTPWWIREPTLVMLGVVA